MSVDRKPAGYWTKERCAEEALKYNTRGEFQKYSLAYQPSRTNDWLDDICSHMKEIFKPDGYWSKEKCQEEALKYNTRGEFHKNAPSCYSKSCKEQWLNDICSHMKNGRILRSERDRKWTLETCKEEALKYTTRKSFAELNGSAYNVARQNGWLNEICLHMKRPLPHNYKWDYNNCKEEASKYKNITEFWKKKHRAYDSAKINGWLDDFFPKK